MINHKNHLTLTLRLPAVSVSLATFYIVWMTPAHNDWHLIIRCMKFVQLRNNNEDTVSVKVIQGQYWTDIFSEVQVKEK
jgi:hypothetical protein